MTSSYGPIYRKMVGGLMTLHERGLAICGLGHRIHYRRDNKAEIGRWLPRERLIGVSH